MRPRRQQIDEPYLIEWVEWGLSELGRYLLRWAEFREYEQREEVNDARTD